MQKAKATPINRRTQYFSAAPLLIGHSTAESVMKCIEVTEQAAIWTAQQRPLLTRRQGRRLCGQGCATSLRTSPFGQVRVGVLKRPFEDLSARECSAKHADGRRKATGLVFEPSGSRRAFFHQRGILLRDLIEMPHRLANLGDAAALLRSG